MSDFQLSFHQENVDRRSVGNPFESSTADS